MTGATARPVQWDDPAALVVPRHLARSVVPIAFTAYDPTVGLLGRDDPLGGPGWLAWMAWMAWMAPVAAAEAGAVASPVGRAGVRSYRSVGA